MNKPPPHTPPPPFFPPFFLPETLPELLSRTRFESVCKEEAVRKRAAVSEADEAEGDEALVATPSEEPAGSGTHRAAGAREGAHGAVCVVALGAKGAAPPGAHGLGGVGWAWQGCQSLGHRCRYGGA